MEQTDRTDRSEEFFDRLAATPQPLLHDVAVTMRIELEENGAPPWHLTIDHGRVAVARSHAAADAVMRTDRALFERVVTGEANALTAGLRGRLRIEGDARLLVAFKSLLPGPPAHRTILPASTAGGPSAAATTDRTTRKDPA